MAEQGEHGISWTQKTWNPIRGCSRVSDGCTRCYAEHVAYRFSAPGQPYEGLVRINSKGDRQRQWNGTVRVVEEHMLDPLRWKLPRRIFVNSMSDLFHENVADETIDRIFAVMALCPQHTFQVLTKRPARMLEYCSTHERWYPVWAKMGGEWPLRNGSAQPSWPLRNVWLGVSCEDQAAADDRIPLLLQTPAAVRWISAEPLLGPLDLREIALPAHDPTLGLPHSCTLDAFSYRWNGMRGLDWVVVGGESGTGARPMEGAWALSLRDQCVAAGVAFHFKQWGEWLPGRCDGAHGDFQHINAEDAPLRVGKRAAGRLLDGRTWDEYPAVQP